MANPSAVENDARKHRENPVRRNNTHKHTVPWCSETRSGTRTRRKRTSKLPTMVPMFLLVLYTIPCVPVPSHGAPSLAAKSWPWMKTYDIWGTPGDSGGSGSARSTETSSSSSTFDPSFDPDSSRRPNGTTGSGGRRSRYSYGEGSLSSFYGDASDGNGLPVAHGAGGRGRTAKGKLKYAREKVTNRKKRRVWSRERLKKKCGEFFPLCAMSGNGLLESIDRESEIEQRSFKPDRMTKERPWPESGP